MRAAVILPLAFGLAAAGPVQKRQEMNFAQIAADRADEIAAIDPADLGPVDPIVQATTVAEATSAYDATSAIAAATSAVATTVEKRDACPTIYTGYGPVVTSAPSDWVSDAALTAPAATATTPQGYVAAANFNNLQGSVQEMGYLTVKTLEEYSPKKCADFCDAEALCMGFNIYFERDPATDTGCAADKNPDSITTIGCTLYAYHVAASKATNTGQWRDNFHVVITGSNGYNKQDTKLSNPTMTSISGFKAPQDFGVAAVNAPKYNDFDSYITYTTYTDAYDPRICAKACQAQTKYDKEHPASDGTYKACNYFVAYAMAKNEEPQGLFCAMYVLPWNSTYAVNTGYYYGSDHYTIYNSLAYTVDSDLDFGNIATISDFVYTDV
ncbi:hypothetical protein GTA08_BOTSDO05634 [Botryosphaeria dothidea]|uniref:Carbohydrate-binding-like protein n=1 Tax=Botryosphaeria dothidea TaxID=55169 RepID=A0A8H4N145_9PEZI|nr:hypothetical protein GTA08_BOTSDO05634 [Botryosphaeria dothidea]